MYSEIFMDVAAALAKTGEHHGNRTFLGQWTDNHWMNTPGTIYCGQTDNCGTGPAEAAENIHVDAEGYEVVYRQPITQAELDQVISAACCDPFSGYGADGNLHWSYEKIKEWWMSREKLIVEVNRLHQEVEESYKEWTSKTISQVDFRYVDLSIYKKVPQWEPKFADVKDMRIIYIECRRKEIQNDVSFYKQWKSFIEQELYQYLQLYAFFIDTGRVACESDTLPDL